MLSNFTAYFFSRLHFARQARGFKYAFYVLVLIKCGWWATHYELLFGAQALSYTGSTSALSPVRSLAYLLYGANGITAAGYWLAALALCAVCGLLLKRFHSLADLLIWFLLINIHNRIYASITGAEFLVNQLALFNIFMLKARPQKLSFFNEVSILLHNFSCFALLLQVCFVYLVSGLSKLTDEEWMSGEALQTISSVHFFNLYSVRMPATALNLISYLILFYQITFPLLIWFRAVKKPLLIAGTVFHLYVAINMGLVAFGLAMILPYIFFWPVKKALTEADN